MFTTRYSVALSREHHRISGSYTFCDVCEHYGSAGMRLHSMKVPNCCVGNKLLESWPAEPHECAMFSANPKVTSINEVLIRKVTTQLHKALTKSKEMSTFNNQTNNQRRHANETKFENGVRSLLLEENSNLKARVCVSCNCFLDSAEHQILSVCNLVKVQKLLKGGTDFLSSLRVYYTAPDCQEGLQQMRAAVYLCLS